VRLGTYPERHSEDPDVFDRSAQYLLGLLARPGLFRQWSMQRFLKRVDTHTGAAAALTDTQLQDRVRVLGRRLQQHGLADPTTSEVFALVREASQRILDMRHYDVQVMGGWTILRGRLAEIETGEGKTLTATLPASAAALAGIPVHIITVNDYLVERDAANMRPLYEFLGLTVGTITEGMEEPSRRAAYACDIVYGTNKQIAFDYLRDRIVMRHAPCRLAMQVESLHNTSRRTERLLMRGLCFAIVDEADSVLIDEACTPLIISQAGQQNTELSARYFEAWSLAAALVETDDYVLNQAARSVHLTATGKQRLAEAAEKSALHWPLQKHCEELVIKALSAAKLYQCDHDYLVKENRVQIIDGFTGRVMADRTWEQGLHQLIEIKEGCEITAPSETVARISYQRFYSRYLQLSGMTGTASEASAELRTVYGLKVVRIPTHRPSRLTAMETQLFPTAEAKWQILVARVQALHRQGRPLLIGTRTVEDSERVSRMLTANDLPHRVLNARQDGEEAELIGNAGRRGSITVATNMAGRGTDIPLGPGVEALGGLHVIAIERNESRRVDRQLYGRCARQGDPGSFESILSLEDDILGQYCPKYMKNMAVKGVRGHFRITAWKSRLLLAVCQLRSEAKLRSRRRALERMEAYLGKILSFAGQQE
jgi:preprotein translocase subunit SecA